LFTRGAALLLAIEMECDLESAQQRRYLAVHEYEFPLTLLTACFALAAVEQERSRSITAV